MFAGVSVAYQYFYDNVGKMNVKLWDRQLHVAYIVECSKLWCYQKYSGPLGIEKLLGKSSVRLQHKYHLNK